MKKKLPLYFIVFIAVDALTELAFQGPVLSYKFWIQAITKALVWTALIYYWNKKSANWPAPTTETYQQIQEKKKLATRR